MRTLREYQTFLILIHESDIIIVFEVVYEYKVTVGSWSRPGCTGLTRDSNSTHFAFFILIISSHIYR